MDTYRDPFDDGDAFPEDPFSSAREALRRGLSVIPVRENKRPLCRWSEYQQRPPTGKELERWQHQKPEGWAVVTGKVSGCIVLDFDGEEGRRTLERLGLEPHILTPSGGAHVYVTHPGWRVSTQNHGANRGLQEAFPGMDVKGDGGYAIAFGRSTHGEYRGRIPRQFLPFESLPAELRQAISGSMCRPPDAPRDAPAALAEHSGGLRDRLIERALELAREGRNNALLWLACQLRDNGFDKTEALKLAERFATLAPQTNAKGTEGPLTPGEIQATVRSAFSRPAREPLEARDGAAIPPGNGATDKGDRLTAHRDTLKELLSGSVRWCPQWKSWLRWNGVRWERCPEEELRSTAYEALRLRYLRLAETAEQRDIRSRAAARLHELESGRYYREALELLKGETGCLTHATEFDRDPNLLNTPSGVVDLRTGELRPARPEDLMTRTTGVPYDPEAGCPQFLEFLQEILPQEGMPGFLQLVLGSGLLGENRFHKGFIFYGSGANGKSTLLKVVQTVAGDYCDPLPRDVLLSRRQQQDAARVALAACEGLRLGLLEELADGAVLSAVALKDLVSNNRIQVRGLYEGYRSAVIGLTLVVATNRKPAIPENTEGVWRRLALVPFTVTIPEERRDPEKAEKLLREAAGILRWMVEGAKLALQSGELETPEAVRSATEEYRTEEDVLAAFLDDCCVLGPRCQVPCGELYAAYQAWCNENTGGRLLSQKAFGQALRDRGIAVELRRVQGRPRRIYIGVGLLPDPPDGSEGVTDVTDGTGYIDNEPAEQNPGDFSPKSVTSVTKEEKLEDGSGSVTDVTDRGHFSKSPRAYIYRENFQKHPVIRYMRNAHEEAAGPSSGGEPPAMPAGPPPDSATGPPQNTTEAGDDASLKTRLRALLERPEGPPVVRLKGVTYSEPRKAIERWLRELEEGPPALRELAHHQAAGYLRSLNENSVSPPDSRKEKT
jgi:putative DNA primase/helicase